MSKPNGDVGNRRPKELAKATFVLLVFTTITACRQPPPESVTLTFLDPQWSHDLTEHNVLPDERLRLFTSQTGVVVKHLPAPEASLDQLAQARKLLRKGASGPDVSGVDVIWPGTLGGDLIDLKPYFAKEISSMDAHVVDSFTVGSKLVAVPYHTDMGVLFYRKDLLRQYGYTDPPRTWAELEKMSLRIQQGERAKGKKKFWGFVWPGAAGEGLTCNALEWQVGEGGGRIIESDHVISVDNPAVVRSWERAAHWIGRISPPGVTSYEEWDAIYSFYLGNAAFYRGWAQAYLLSVKDRPWNRNYIGITAVPGGKVSQAGTSGGYGLGISRSAAHSKEALELVRFLLGEEIQSELERPGPESNDTVSIDNRTAILSEYSKFNAMGGGVVSRPSAVTGENYEDVSRAYSQAVHSVLIGRITASKAAENLEVELAKITGFKANPEDRPSSPRD